MPAAQFPEPQKLDILEIGDGLDHMAGKYTLEKPHPGYGKDPNIINHYGHTVYPKLVYPNGVDAPAVMVRSTAEEAKVMGTEVETPKLPKSQGWE